MGEYLPALILIAILLHQAIYARFHKRYRWHFQRGEYNEARENLTWMSRLNPFDGTTYYQRALINMDQGNWQQAAKDLTKAVRWKANYREAYETRAQVYEALGETERAKSDKRRARELDLMSSA